MNSRAKSNPNGANLVKPKSKVSKKTWNRFLIKLLKRTATKDKADQEYKEFKKTLSQSVSATDKVKPN